MGTRIIFFIFCVFSTYVCASTQEWQKKEMGTPLFPLVHKSDATGTQWQLSTNAGFLMTDLARNKQAKIDSLTMLLRIDSSSFSINGVTISSRSVQIESTDGILNVNGVSYKGVLIIKVAKNKRSVFIVGTKDIFYVPFLSDNELVEKNSGKQKSESFKMRVLLDQLKEDGCWRLSSEQGFIVRRSGNDYKPEKIVSLTLVIDQKHKSLFLNNKKCIDESIYIMPIDEGGTITFDGRLYQGAFLVAQHKGVLSLINSIDLEEYICAVLRTESLPGWPLEIHKVCAIACRTYAIAMAIRANKLKRIYHIKSTNHHQTYAGFHTNKVLQKAVDETRGVFIAYNNEPIIAMYDICCGGIIPAHIGNFDFQHAPYLARKYACSYCKICKPYSWKTVCTLDDFEKLVSKSIKKVKNIKSVTVSKKDRAGLAHEIVLKNSGRPLVVSGKKMYSLMKDIRSFCFKTNKQGNTVVIQGRGFGHHIGLCQWGAREMVRSGWKYKDILQFYYPGTHFMRIT